MPTKLQCLFNNLTAARGGMSSTFPRQSVRRGFYLPDALKLRALLHFVCLFWACALALKAQAGGPFDIRIATEFNRVVDTNITALSTNATVSSWLEGPVWVPSTNSAGGWLLFSAMDINRVKKLVPPSTVTDYLAPSSNAIYNGSTLDCQERLVTCQSGGGGLRVVMVTNGVVNGAVTNIVTTLASTCAGLKFYSPNDVVVKSDGTVWFTDPGFNGGINLGASGFPAGYYVYRFSETNGNATCKAVLTNISKPNGLCFSPDESRLYVADYYAALIRAYSVSPSNTLSGGSAFVSIPNGNGNPDGIRCDVDGRIYSSSSDGIWIFMPDGRLIGRIITANTVANLCFGGPDWRTLYIAAQPNILSIRLKVAGTPSLRKLSVSPNNGSSVRVSWPAPSTGFALETSANPGASNWSRVQTPPTVSNGVNLTDFSSSNSPAFFRLRKPTN